MRAVPSLTRLEELCGGLSPRSSICEAARALLCLQARRLEACLPAALAGPEPAPLHDARVAGRRLRAGIALFGRLYPGIRERAERAARNVTSGFRAARDLDIRCARLRRMMMATTELSPRSSAIAGNMLRETLAERGRLARPAGPTAVDIAGTLLPALWRPRTSRAPAADRFVRVGLRELAQRAAFLIPVASVETHGGVQHRLRIRCKALRYSLEMMEWQLGAQAAWRLDILRKVQDELGELHDIDVFCGYLAERSGSGALHGSGRAGDIGRRLGDERHRYFERFQDIREEIERAVAPVIF